MEQEPINAEVSKTLNVSIEEIDAVKNPQYIKEYELKATPTILVINDEKIVERFEGVVHTEPFEAAIKKYL
jgi:thioredoxin 1